MFPWHCRQQDSHTWSQLLYTKQDSLYVQDYWGIKDTRVDKITKTTRGHKIIRLQEYTRLIKYKYTNFIDYSSSMSKAGKH